LSEQARDFYEYVALIWPTPDDCNCAAFATGLSNCYHPGELNRLRSDWRRKFVVVHGDTEESKRQAKDLAQECLNRGAEKVWLYQLIDFGTDCGTIREWCEQYSLPITLDVAVAGERTSFVSFSPQESPTFEGAPRQLSVALLPVPELDPLMLPAIYREWLCDIAARGCFPLEYPAAAAIVATAGLIGRKLAIRPKRHDDWLVVPNLWGAAVGPPGIQKTPAVAEALRPLHRLAADASEAHKQEIIQWEARQLVASTQKSATKDRMKAVAKRSNSDAELLRMAESVVAGDSEEEPQERRYVVNDVTVEKLGEILAANPQGLTLFRDELVGFLKSLDRQGHESDRGFILECWNGTGSFTFDRIQRGKIHIPAACLSIFGTIQPGPLARYLRGALSGDEADGFIPRFQIMVYPDPPAEFALVDRYPETAAKNVAYGAFQAIDSTMLVECQFDEERGIPYINFSDEAQEFFDEWRIGLENRLRSGAINGIMAMHLAKYRSLMPSLALIFHVIDMCARNWLSPVSIHAAGLAAAWCELLEAHARRIYQSASDGDIDVAMTLAERIQQSLPNPFTIRDVQRKGWSGLSSNEEVRRAIDFLEDRNWVRVVQIPSSNPKGGRPFEQVWIHPDLPHASTEDGA
jgi:putative DNA primase/helicase